MKGMKMKTFARLSCFVVYIALACIPVDATPRSVNESNPVRKIYIAKAEPFENREPFISRWKRFNSYLKQELTRFGFIVVDEKANADAILSGNFGEEVMVDGPQANPPKLYYDFELILPTNEKVWRIEFDVRSRSGVLADEKAARKIAEEMSTAWQESWK